MIISILCISFSITLFYALWAGSYCKKILLPIMGFVALIALSIVAVLIGYNLSKVTINESGLIVIGMLGLSVHPLILLFFLRKKVWNGVYLTLFALVNTLINLCIYEFEVLDLVFRLGSSIPYALYTPLVFALWTGLMAVRDVFSLKETICTCISAAIVTYLPIAICVAWGSYPDSKVTDVLSKLPFLFVGFVVLFGGTALIYQMLRARKQAIPAD
ncbi:MAG: hypothetical protein IJX47_07855 [Clostridia bacterium]|nr:hypothetical protein [Clostridia bacterium]